MNAKIDGRLNAEVPNIFLAKMRNGADEPYWCSALTYLGEAMDVALNQAIGWKPNFSPRQADSLVIESFLCEKFLEGRG